MTPGWLPSCICSYDFEEGGGGGVRWAQPMHADVVVLYNQLHICALDIDFFGVLVGVFKEVSVRVVCLNCRQTASVWEGPVFIPEFWLTITGTSLSLLPLDDVLNDFSAGIICVERHHLVKNAGESRWAIIRSK